MNDSSRRSERTRTTSKTLQVFFQLRAEFILTSRNKRGKNIVHRRVPNWLHLQQKVLIVLAELEKVKIVSKLNKTFQTKIIILTVKQGSGSVMLWGYYTTLGPGQLAMKRWILFFSSKSWSLSISWWLYNYRFCNNTMIQSKSTALWLRNVWPTQSLDPLL